MIHNILVIDFDMTDALYFQFVFFVGKSLADNDTNSSRQYPMRQISKSM